ncbi:MAG: DUF4290 domain-containing protein [Chitinophagales bacterium]|nr:DUF4290 domain-containing protein [Chitinophagales bacterium]MCO5279483.1 DUF4290 domain-containing protein [Chitinophagales bacterium]OJV24406.1 MAG: hypothetical protein BGO32_01655 [Bacteroidetes bacterium 37-13]HRN95079.1 DUF4290 domain-containing protein [Chitinophagales bacterium]HRP39299.1 DUF4290 domain-containing protein [Chitinophagales bacterium]
MFYNTSREHLIIREYGRHVQRIVARAMQIEDREERNRFANEIIELMGQLNPHLRNVEDFKHKLWDHLFVMSNYQLDVDSPYPKKTKEELTRKPTPMPYPKSKIRFKHYGKHVETLVKKALETDDIEKRDGLAHTIGNYMKLVYQNWNKESANEDVIKDDLRLLSGGALSLDREANINLLSRGGYKPQPQQNNNNRNGGSKNKKFKNKKKFFKKPQ